MDDDTLKDDELEDEELDEDLEDDDDEIEVKSEFDEEKETF